MHRPKFIAHYEKFQDYVSERFSWCQIDYAVFPLAWVADKKLDGDTQSVCNAVIIDCFCVQKDRQQRKRDGTYAGERIRFNGSHPYKKTHFVYDITVDGKGMLEVIFHGSNGRLKMAVRKGLIKSFGKSLVEMPVYFVD